MLDIVILAAGKGTRMKSETPKVLHTIGGQSLLHHVHQAVQQLSANTINVVIGHGADQVSTAVSQFGSPIDLNLVEQTEQLGTGHAVLQALPFLDDNSTVLILCGDVPLIRTSTLDRLVSDVTDTTMGLLTIHMNDPTGLGRIVRRHGKVEGIVEQRDATDEQATITEVNTGIMAVKAHCLKRWLPALSSNNAQGEYYLTDIIAMACDEKIAIATHHPESEAEVTGINNRKQQAQLERAYQTQVANALLEEGVQLIDSERFDCRGSIKAGHDVIIDINCVFEGDVTLGNHVVIEPNCIIRNSTIDDYTIIKANTMIDSSEVGKSAVVGPFARLRPGTKLSSETKIGNFVETKKAIVGHGSKINHLSYVGDTQMGKHVNIGAGTITCNYDGVNKFTTTIEDNAFIGSNSALVAPVTIGQGATIGAGSTITKSVEAGKLTLTRAIQKTHSQWQRPTKL